MRVEKLSEFDAPRVSRDRHGQPVHEIDGIRLALPLEGKDGSDDSRIVPLPAGAEGTVVHIFTSGDAFMVEFLVFDRPSDPEKFTTVLVDVTSDQCELAWKAPA